MSDSRLPEALGLLRTAYGDLAATLGSLSAEEGWEPTGCAGWTVVDLGFHLLSDARRALVALNTPAEGPAVVYAFDYWRADRTPAADEADGLWDTRVAAAVQGGLVAIARRYAAASAAVLVAVDRVGQTDMVGNRGAAMTVPDLVSTLTVEAAVHHLDLVVRLNRPGPSAGPLAEVRRILEGLLGAPLPARWDDATAARGGTGREPLTAADRAELGKRTAEFPLFG